MATGREKVRYGDPVRGNRLSGGADRGAARFAVSPDGRHVATAGDGCGVRVWDLASGRAVRAFDGHPAPVLALAFAPGGEFLVTAAADGVGLVWRLDPPTDGG